MKKRTRSLGLVGVGLMVAACSGGDGEPAPLPTMAENGADLARKLDSLTGATWWMEPGVAGNAALYYARGEGRPVLPNAQRSPTDIIALLTPFASDLGLGSDPSHELDEPETLLDASDEDVGTYRFRQHLPGTSIPVFDAALVAAVTKEGSLEYLSTGHARNLGTVGAHPTLDGDDAANRALKTLGSTARQVSAPTLGVLAVDPAKPRLSYRFSAEVDDALVQVTCDAHTGDVLSARHQGAAATAFAAAHYFDTNDIRQDRSSMLSVDLTPQGELSTTGATGPIRIYNEDGKLAVCSRPSGTSGQPEAPYECDVNVRQGSAKGVAADVQAHLQFASVYFANQLQARKWAAGGAVEAFVNARTVDGRRMQGDGRYVPPSNPRDTGKLFFGIGRTFEDADPKGHAGNKTYETYPTGSSFEFVAHEYAHGVIDAVGPLSYVGEAGALNEGLADIFAAHATALLRSNDIGLHTFGEDVRWDGRPLRDFRRPGNGTDVGGTIDYAARRPTIPSNANRPECQGAQTPESCATTCSFDAEGNTRSKNDCGNIHYNSTIVTNAWSLLAIGGFNQATKKGVLAEVGLSRATRLFYAALLGAPVNDTMKLFASRMISHQVKTTLANPFKTDLEPLWVKKAVVCAWNATNVIPDGEVIQHAVGLSCPKAGELTRTCKGKADGYYCNPDVNYPYDSYQCKGGAIAGGHQCASGSFCHRLTLNPESSAVLDAQNKPRCFIEPMVSDF
ncbi:MAG: M4 family metallopeptidase [Myxococcales bacterium]|nr:M4 family metallopeptidase [Myxococcales bacterium]